MALLAELRNDRYMTRHRVRTAVDSVEYKLLLLLLLLSIRSATCPALPERLFDGTSDLPVPRVCFHTLSRHLYLLLIPCPTPPTALRSSVNTSVRPGNL